MKDPGKRKNTRNIITGLLLVVNLLIIFGFTWEANRTHKKMEELVGQISYLSDSASILLSNVDNLRAEMEESLAESKSLLETWSISLSSMDFEKETYTVDVQVVPKEFTDTMEISVYFGTKPVPLYKMGFRYKGSVELSLEEAYDNNVAVLLSDGNSRKTEVLSDYSDVRTDLTNVLYGNLPEAPSYEEGNLKIKGTGYVRLDAGDFFTFKELRLMVEKDEQEMASYDLAAMSKGDSAVKSAPSSASEETAEPETQQEEAAPAAVEEGQPLTWLAYSYMLEEEIPMEGAGHVRIYLRAVAENGFVFTYDLQNFDLEEEKILAEEGTDQQDAQGDAAKDDAPETGSSGDDIADNTDNQNGTGEKTEAAGGNASDTASNSASGKTTFITKLVEDSVSFEGHSVVYDPKGHSYVLK